MNTNTIWEAWGRTNALYTTWCAEMGENPYRLFVLYALDAHEPITQKGIAACTGLSKQTVSTVMRQLKEEKLVSLCTEGTDRREKAVRFTPAGRAYAEGVLAPLQRLEARAFEMMGAERMKQMADSITLFNMIFEKEMEKQKYE